MPDQSGIPLEGTKVDAASRSTSLSTTATVRLFKQGFTPTPSSVAADFIAQEATYQGYASQTVAAWHAPELNGSAGYMIYGTSVLSFTWVAGTGDPDNTIGGYWVQDAGGKARGYTIFQTPVTLSGADQVLPLIPVLTSSVVG